MLECLGIQTQSYQIIFIFWSDFKKTLNLVNQVMITRTKTCFHFSLYTMLSTSLFVIKPQYSSIWIFLPSNTHRLLICDHDNTENLGDGVYKHFPSPSVESVCCLAHLQHP